MTVKSRVFSLRLDAKPKEVNWYKKYEVLRGRCDAAMKRRVLQR